MKVAFISNINDTCGIATYGEDLLRYAQPEVDYVIIPLEYSLEQIKSVASDCDLFHLNYYHGLTARFSYPELLLNFPSKPFVLTNHAINRQEKWFDRMSAIVTHIKPLTKYHKNIHVIPHGIPEKDFEFEDWGPLRPMVLAQAGFPFAWKNFPKVCEAANAIYDMALDVSVNLFMPNTYRWDYKIEVQKCQDIINPKIPLNIETRWIHEDELIPRLHKEASVIVCYTGGSNGGDNSEGPSGSVRLAIAAKRPVIVNGNASQYKDILDERGIYPAFNEEQLVEEILQAQGTGVYAKNLIEKQSYRNITIQYTNLYKEMI